MKETSVMEFSDDEPIEDTGLFGTKEVIALALCGVGTVGAFAAMDLMEVRRLRGYGTATRRRLEKVQRKLRVASDLVPATGENDEKHSA